MIVLYNCGKLLNSKPGYTNGYITTAYTLKKRFGCVATWISYIVYMSL